MSFAESSASEIPAGTPESMAIGGAGGAPGESPPPARDAIRIRKARVAVAILVVLVGVIVYLLCRQHTQLATVTVSPTGALADLRYSTPAARKANMTASVQAVQVTGGTGDRTSPSLLTVRIPVSRRLCVALARRLDGGCGASAASNLQAPDISIYSSARMLLSLSARVTGLTVKGPGLSGSISALLARHVKLSVPLCARPHEILVVQVGHHRVRVPCATYPQHETLVIRGRYGFPPGIGLIAAESLTLKLGSGVLTERSSAATVSTGSDTRRFRGVMGTTEIDSKEDGFAVVESTATTTIVSRSAKRLIAPDRDDMVPSGFESTNWFVIALVGALIGSFLSLVFDLVTDRTGAHGGTAHTP